MLRSKNPADDVIDLDDDEMEVDEDSIQVRTSSHLVECPRCDHRAECRFFPVSLAFYEFQNFVLAKSVHFKCVSHQAAQLSIHFFVKEN